MYYMIILIAIVGLGEMVGIEDQFPLPEDMRPFPTPRHPNCRKELWRSQDDI
jgi:hypothetical protein